MISPRHRFALPTAFAALPGKAALGPQVPLGVDVTLLYFEGCPNWQLADGRLREALTRAERSDVHVEYRRVTTPEEAEAIEFRGSPTVLVNGRDPFADANSPVGLSCRVYRTDAGLAGAPTVEQLLAVLTNAGRGTEPCGG